VAAIGGMGLAAVWLRGFKPNSVLAAWTVRGLLFIALVAIIAATILGTKLSGLAVLVAALATFGATLIRSEPADRLALLTAVALVGMGGGFIADAISPSTPRVTSEGRLMSAALGGLFVLVGMSAMWAGSGAWAAGLFASGHPGGDPRCPGRRARVHRVWHRV
jgi:hypothetical protein